MKRLKSKMVSEEYIEPVYLAREKPLGWGFSTKVDAPSEEKTIVKEIILSQVRFVIHNGCGFAYGTPCTTPIVDLNSLKLWFDKGRKRFTIYGSSREIKAANFALFFESGESRVAGHRFK